MTEEEYVRVGDIARMRAALALIRDCAQMPQRWTLFNILEDNMNAAYRALPGFEEQCHETCRQKVRGDSDGS